MEPSQGADEILRRNKSSQQQQRKMQMQPTDQEAEASWHFKWAQAEQVEEAMMISLHQLETTDRIVLFPPVRSCNAALATFGDAGDYLRALRLFLKMRKCANIRHQTVPAPTLVTYSTMMSRALTVGNPNVALRLWNLMKLQTEFFSSQHGTKTTATTTANVILPDVKAANILMNVHAKLADVDSAWYLLDQMIHGNGTDVPKLTPNLVTYNTLLDACGKARDLDAALVVKALLHTRGIRPDARTYTTLMATVARKSSHASGARDVSVAFAWLQEMQGHHIAPNGRTYSALIDACGRAGRSDLALKGLRLMLRQKKEMQLKKLELMNEVGAWTAAINALGRAGRVDTAMRLFYSMPKFDVHPNTITCGSLADCLLRQGRMAETLEVLRYMKRAGIAPNEVIYTSLMTSAERLVKMEKNRVILEESHAEGHGDTKAIEVYTELMKALMDTTNGDSSDSNTLLMKVFLVFQEMKTAGAEPDLACYNALLRACARAGDVDRALQVMRRLQAEGLHPNDKSWRELVRAAAKVRRSDLAEAVWAMGKNYQGRGKRKDNAMSAMLWKPSVESFGDLVHAYLRESHVVEGDDEKRMLLKKIIVMYRNIMTGSEGRIVDKADLLGNQSVLLMILQAIVAWEKMEQVEKHKVVLKNLGRSIATLESMERIQVGSRRENNRSLNSLRIARTWVSENERAS
jgi:pentatricopeptide repeat protein